MPSPQPAQPIALNRTVRIIGIAVAARGKAVDIALLETDAGSHIRLIDLERRPLDVAMTEGEAIADVLSRFIGDRALQPFAIDALALEHFPTKWRPGSSKKMRPIKDLAPATTVSAQWLGARIGIAAFEISATQAAAETTRRHPKRFARAEVLALVAAGLGVIL